MQDPWVSFWATLFGAFIALAGSLIATIVTHNRDYKRFLLEWKKERYDQRSELLLQQQSEHIVKIEQYARTRLDLINILAKPLVHPQNLIDHLLADVWKTGGESWQAKASALILSDEQLGEELGQLEHLFYEIWGVQRYAPEEISYEEIASRAEQLGVKIFKRLDLQKNLLAQRKLLLAREVEEFLRQPFTPT